MATLAANNPTLLDLVNAQDPDGTIAPVIELLNETNEILDDMGWQEGNLTTGHQTTIRTGLPTPTWRKFYGGVQPTKSTRAPITDTCGMMEDYAEVDKKLADMHGQAMAFRMSEDAAHLEGFNQDLARVMFYGDQNLVPEEFNGLAPRYNDLSAESGENIIDAGGTGSDNASIWLATWGPQASFGIVPKNSKAGFQLRDLGEVTIEDVDGNGGRMQAYRTHMTWDAGLCVRDWRRNVRICNIDKSLLSKDVSTGADIADLMTQAIELLPEGNMGRMAFYVPRTVRSMLRRQITDAVKNSTLTMGEIAGRKVVMFDGIPVRRCDALAADEARVT